MIHIEFTASEGYGFMLTIKGHAGAGEKDHDLVCAGVSMLTYTIAQNVHDFKNSKMLETSPTIKTEEGDSVITVNPKARFKESILMVLMGLVRGFDVAAETYPEYIEFKRFGNSDAS